MVLITLPGTKRLGLVQKYYFLHFCILHSNFVLTSLCPFGHHLAVTFLVIDHTAWCIPELFCIGQQAIVILPSWPIQPHSCQNINPEVLLHIHIPMDTTFHHGLMQGFPCCQCHKWSLQASLLSSRTPLLTPTLQAEIMQHSALLQPCEHDLQNSDNNTTTEAIKN